MAYPNFAALIQDIESKLHDNSTREITEGVMRALLSQISTFLNVSSGSILYGTTAPQNSLGADGAFYLNRITWTIYGPKAGGAWPTGASLIGPKGDKGDKGDTGLQGPQGIQGNTGPQGAQGPQGATGAQGANGTQGVTGSQGPQGLQGPAGPQGIQGIQGPAGATGPKGDKGDTGEVRYLAGETDEFILSIKRIAEGQLLKYGYKPDDLTSSGVKLAFVGDSQGTNFFTGAQSIEARTKLTYPNLTVTNYCVSGYNSRRMMPNGSNQYVDTAKNITKAIADGNNIIIIIDTSNDSDSTNPAGGEVPIVEWQTNLDVIDQYALNAGADIFFISTFPRPQLNSTAQQKQKDMAMYYLRRFRNRCIFAYKAVADPTNDLNLNPAYQVGDNIHLNQSGAGVVFNVLNATLLYHYLTISGKISLYNVFNSNALNGIYVKYQSTSNNKLVTAEDERYYKVQPVYVDGFVDKFTNIVRGIGSGNPINQPPTVQAGGDQIITLPTDNVTLTAEAQDADGNIVAFLWTKAVGPQGSEGIGFNGGAFTPTRTFEITPDGNGELIIDNTSGTYHPGDLINLNGTFTAITLINLAGASGNPIVFRNKPGTILNVGNPTYAGSGKSYAIGATNSRNFIFAGHAPEEFLINGSTIDTIPSGGQEPYRTLYRNISMDALTELFEFCYFTANDGGTSIVAKTDPTASANTQFPNRVLGKMIFHDFIVDNPFNEGMYLGHTATYWNLTKGRPYYGVYGDTGNSDWYPTDTYVQPILWEGVEVYNYIVKNSGKDGVQIAAANNIKVFQGEVTNWASQDTIVRPQHNGGILIGGRTTNSDVHDNWVHDSWGEAYQFYGTGTGHKVTNNLFKRSTNNDLVSIRGSNGAQVLFERNTFVLSASTKSLLRVNGNTNMVNGQNPIQAIVNRNLFIGPRNDMAAGGTVYDSYYIYTENPIDGIVQKGTGANINVFYPKVADANVDTGNYYLPNNQAVTQGFRKNTSIGPVEPGSANSAIIVNPTNITTQVTGLTIAGQYKFGVLVTDNLGATAYDEVSITVQAQGANQPPIVEAGNPQTITLPTSQVTLIATASDPDGSIASVLWTKVSGPDTFTIATPTQLSTNITGLIEGVYVFGFAATDDDGLSSSDTVAVTVNSGAVQLAKWQFSDPGPTQQVAGFNLAVGGGLNTNLYGKVWLDEVNGSGISMVHLVTDSTTATQKWGPVYFSNNASSNNAAATAPNFAKDGWWSYQRAFVNQATSSQFKFIGLQVGQLYRVRLYSSLAGSFSLDANPTVLIINGNVGGAVERDAIDNNLADSTKWAEITAIAPNSSGEIFVAICSKAGSSDFAMVNAIEIEKL
jgi:hypothetical protein